MEKSSALQDARIDVKIKLSALWASVMFCYIYADYFGLYKPGTLQEMLAGRMAPFGATTQGVLLGTSLMMAIPSVLIFLPLVLPAAVSRWMNILFGVVYTLIIVWTLPGSWLFYVFFGAIEVVLTGLVVFYAWTWPAKVNESA